MRFQIVAVMDCYHHALAEVNHANGMLSHWLPYADVSTCALQSTLKGYRIGLQFTVPIQLLRIQIPLIESFAMAQPKLTDFDFSFWFARMPLYVSRLRPRLNIGSVSIRLHRHGSGCTSGELSLSTPTFTLY
jgi:hypothetical protein